MRGVTGRFLYIALPAALNLEYFFLHGLNESRSVVGRAKEVGDVPRTYVGNPLNLRELRFPAASVRKAGILIRMVPSSDTMTHPMDVGTGFIARPAAKAVSDGFGNIYTVT